MDILSRIKNEYYEQVSNRKKDGKFKQVLVCTGSSCLSNKAKGVIDKFQELCKDHSEIKLVKTGCFGLCALGPAALVFPEGVFYQTLDECKVERIFKEHLIGGRIVFDLVYNKKDNKLIDLNSTPFYNKQLKIALRNCGIIDPNSIEEYIARDGYFALKKCLFELSSDQIIEEIKKSGLRGRGGGGFPTGKKWEITRASQSNKKYVCCNADEGDPGAFMDRTLLEGDPHSVIEAMIIAAFVIGADEGYIYVRAEYPLAIKVLKNAIIQAKKYGLLGKNILSTGFNFELNLRFGAGAFVCGEETALMTSIEGKRGEPHLRPPYPAVKGLFGEPTLLNNVETYANIPAIILNGASWFNQIGTEKSKGTKVFSLGGKITHTGLVEIPMGTKLKDVVFEIGGGIPNNKKFKAVQTGGPSGGCISAANQDVSIDYDSLIQAGSMMGSGGMIVMDEDTCMVDIAKFFMHFMVDESCGKCVPCRIGNKRLYEMLDRITKGQGSMEELEKIKELGMQIKQNSLCGLGQSAPNPTLSTIENFYDEYVMHIKDKHCPAFVCEELRKFSIDKDKCVGCSVCAEKCPVGAISGETKKPFIIDQSKCTKCGECFNNCNFSAIRKD